MRYKSWPYYEDWKEIFGKDRANGDAAEDIMDAWNDINLGKNAEEDGTNGHAEMSMDNLSTHEGTPDTVSHTHVLGQPDKLKGKKRKAGEEMQGVCQVLREIGVKTDARLGELTKRIGYDFDVSRKRKEAFDLLTDIQGLSLEDRFDICDHLAKEVEKLDVFMGLPQDARSPYVMRILKNLKK